MAIGFNAGRTLRAWALSFGLPYTVLSLLLYGARLSRPLQHLVAFASFVVLCAGPPALLLFADGGGTYVALTCVVVPLSLLTVWLGKRQSSLAVVLGLVVLGLVVLGLVVLAVWPLSVILIWLRLMAEAPMSY
jgi:hypothetical protein